MTKITPSIDRWLAEAAADPQAAQCGMYLIHKGVVRATPKRAVREGAEGLGAVVGLKLSYDAEAVEEALAQARTWPGVHYVKGWFNEGELAVGDAMMLLLVGADIRPHAVDALERLLTKLKTELLEEREILG